ncbi:MAG: site-2 protease family protein [Thermodesulfobacteriota bacterium]
MPDKPKGLRPVRSKVDVMAEMIQQGLQIPWQGIRPDLMLHKGAVRMDDKESYILEDPVRGSHFELGEAEARFFLCLVTETDLKASVQKLLRTTSFRPSVEEILAFLKMLQKEKLAVLPPETALSFAEFREEKKPSIFKKVITGYLFIKIPLLRPDGVLNALYPWLKFLWSRFFLFLYAVMGVTGLIFALEQIELYMHTASHLFTPKGALMFMVCLSVLKTLHEFGHGLAAKHYGLYVRRMGLAFMVFMPILYTDVTEAWKLPSQRGRLAIGAAGILVEICIAAVSLFLWSVLTDGIFRSLMFFMSGTSLISTVLVNLNPLMRFDGYYILMDYLRISNLRTRSVEMFKYYRRKLMVDWQGPKPEEHPWENGLVIFGLFTTLYRFFIFFSITLAIYHMVFKALGVLLVTMQILLMLVLPATMETFFLLKNRDKWGGWKRVTATGFAVAVLMALLLFPFPNVDKLPGLFLYEKVARLEAPGKGRIVSELPKEGTVVQRGDLVLRIQSDSMEQSLEEQAYDLAKVEESLKTIAGGGKQGGYRKWLLAERQRLMAAIEKTRQTLSQLEIRAPVSGRILDVNKHLSKGAYVRKKGYLLALGDFRQTEVRAYADESRYKDLKETTVSRGRIIFKDLETATSTGRFLEILDFPVTEFPNNALFDFAGGDIPSLSSGDKQIRAKKAFYPLIFQISGSPPLRHGTPCFVQLKGSRSSLMEDGLKWVWRGLSSEGLV